jgi:hypothetical protein
MREILHGIFHWSAIHEKIGIPVHSYYLAGPRVLIDPMTPAEGIDGFRERGGPREILLTNRHHYRHSARFVKAFGAKVRCHRAGLHEFTKGEKVEPFDHGDELPGGILALEVGVLCPEETALYIAAAGGAGGGRAVGRGTSGGRGKVGQLGVMAFGDALIRGPDGELGFVPDKYMGEDPQGVKRGLRTAFRRLLERDFECLLLAHGEPLVRGGRRALERFLRIGPAQRGPRRRR